MTLRFPDDLPASELIEGKADHWQVAHALLFLAERVLRKHPGIDPALVVGHRSPIHALVNLHDLGMKGQKRWMRVIMDGTRRLEAML